MIISITGFGIVDVEQVSAENGELGFIESLRGVTEGMIIKLTFPEWAYKLPFELPRHTKRCFTELESTLRELIISRKIEIKAGLQHSDLFSMLLEGDKYGSESTLSADEILSNCYVFLLAGQFLFSLLRVQH